MNFTLHTRILRTLALLGLLHTHFIHSTSNSTVNHLYTRYWCTCFCNGCLMMTLHLILTSHHTMSNISCIFVSKQIQFTNKCELIETISMWSTVALEIKCIKGVWIQPVLEKLQRCAVPLLESSSILLYCNFHWFYTVDICDSTHQKGPVGSEVQLWCQNFWNRTLRFWDMAISLATFWQISEMLILRKRLLKGCEIWAKYWYKIANHMSIFTWKLYFCIKYNPSSN